MTYIERAREILEGMWNRQLRDEAFEALLPLLKRADEDKLLLDVVTRDKSPCGHWQAYAVTLDGGKHITCLQCRVDSLSSSRETLKRAILKAGEFEGDISPSCQWCGRQQKSYMEGYFKHKPDCLWVKLQAEEGIVVPTDEADPNTYRGPVLTIKQKLIPLVDENVPNAEQKVWEFKDGSVTWSYCSPPGYVGGVYVCYADEKRVTIEEFERLLRNVGINPKELFSID